MGFWYVYCKLQDLFWFTSASLRCDGVLWFKKPLESSTRPSGSCFGFFLLVCGSYRWVRAEKSEENASLIEYFSCRKHVHVIKRSFWHFLYWYTWHSIDCIQFDLDCLCDPLPRHPFTRPPPKADADSIPGGDKALTKQPLRVATILLESAVINVPIAVASAVGLQNNKIFGGAVGFVVPPIQVCATWLM